MKIFKNKDGQIVGLREIETPISISQIKFEIESLNKSIDSNKKRLNELESTLKEVEELEKKK